jgi:hypothetical protein
MIEHLPGVRRYTHEGGSQESRPSWLSRRAWQQSKVIWQIFLPVGFAAI